MIAMNTTPKLRAGMVGMGMIFDETYRPFFEHAHSHGLYRRDFGLVEVELSAVASRTGSRAEKYRQTASAPFVSFAGAEATPQLLQHGVDAVCVATPDDRHFESARLAMEAGKHVLIEKPSVLTLQELDALATILALQRRTTCWPKIVYHKLGDPDRKKLRTHYVDGNFQHVNNGYCTLLEPKSISGQFAEWIKGRNPGTYVAVHYIKLIDFTFLPSPLAGEGWG